MIHIYHSTNTRSVRVIWLCEELDLAYRIVAVDFSAEYRRSPEWRCLNPVGKLPVLTDDAEDPPLTIFESGAMVQHLLDRHGAGRLRPPPGVPELARYLQWSWFAEATLLRPIGEIVNHRRIFDPTIPEVVAEMEDRAELALQALGDAVSDRDYLLGADFTAADIMTGYSLMIAHRVVPARMPQSVLPYWERLRARPAYRRTAVVQAQAAGCTD